MIGSADGQPTEDEYIGTFEYLYFSRQPSARAEAMGRTIAATDAGAFAAFYNPAGIGSNEGLILSSSYSDRFYAADESNFKFIGLTYGIGKYGVIGLSMFRFRWRVPLAEEKTIPIASLYTLTLAGEPLHDLYVGVNLNVVRNYLGFDILGKAYPVDVGLRKIFRLPDAKVMDQMISVAASLDDLLRSKLIYDVEGSPTGRERLPQTIRIGAAYEASLGSSQIHSTKLRTLGILVQVEYQHLLNSKFRDALRGGLELKIFEMLKLRLGRYREEIDHRQSEGKPTFTEFTYGLGIEVPIGAFTRNHIPIRIMFDFTRLPQNSYSKNYDPWGDFTAIDFSVGWSFK